MKIPVLRVTNLVKKLYDNNNENAKSLAVLENDLKNLKEVLHERQVRFEDTLNDLEADIVLLQKENKLEKMENTKGKWNFWGVIIAGFFSAIAALLMFEGGRAFYIH